MEPNPLIQFSVRDAFRVLFRQKRRVMLVFALFATLAFAAVVVAPRTYCSESRLFVRIGNESLNIDPTLKAGAVSLQVAREEEIKSLVDLFHNLAIAQQVVRELGAEAILTQSIEPKTVAGEESNDALTMVKAGLKSLRASSKITREELAARQVVKSVDIGSEPKSSVILVAARANSPEFAQKLVDAYVAAALEKHVEAHRTRRSLPFFDQQSKQLKSKLSTATRELRDLKSKFGLVSISGQKQMLERQIGEVEQLISRTETNLESFQAKVTALRGLYPDAPPVDPATSSSRSSQSLDDMRNQLFTLQIQLSEIDARFTSDHPTSRATREQVRSALDELNIHELRFAEASVADLNNRLVSLRDEQRNAFGRLRDLNENEVQIDALQREVDMLRTNYVAYSTNRETSRINEELKKQQITNINVIQPASLRRTPAAPSRVTLLALGVAFAFFAAFGSAVLFEFLDGTLRTAAEVETRTDLPVLLSVPALSRRQVLLN